MSGKIIANRTDGTTERLMALFNGLYISEKCGHDFVFRWPVAETQATGSQRVPAKEELFSSDFINKYYDDTTDYTKIVKLPNKRKAPSLSRLFDILKLGSWLSTKDHLEDKYGNWPEANYGFGKFFNEQVFSAPIAEVIAKAAQAAERHGKHVALHLRAGDVLYGEFRHHGIFAEMCIPLPIAKFLIKQLNSSNQKAILFGQDKATMSYLMESGLDCVAASTFYEEFNISSDLERLMFDVALMSKMTRIIAGGSGVARLASCVGDTPCNYYSELISLDEQVSITDSDVEAYHSDYTNLQCAFAYWAAYFRSKDGLDYRTADRFLERASAYDPENYCYIIKRIALNYKNEQDEKVDEILRSSPVLSWPEKSREFINTVMARNIAIPAFLYDKELPIFVEAARRGSENAVLIAKGISKIANKANYPYARELSTLLPDMGFLSWATPGNAVLERVSFQVNKTIGVVEVPITRGMNVVPISQESESRGLIRTTKLKGGGNFIYVGEGTDISRIRFDVVGSNNKLIIGRNCIIRGMISFRGNGNIIFIGAGTTFNEVTIISKYNGNVYIGKDCMFSSKIEVRSSDSHAVIDLETMSRSNNSDGIYIGDHVWVGKGAVIQKGAVIASDNVIGISSFVRGHFPDSSTIIAGSPAKVVRKNKSWARNELFDAEKEDLYAWRQLPII